MKRLMTALYVAAQEDEPLRQRLERHLTLLEQRGLMQGWHVQQIVPGSVEAESRDAALEKASLVLLLISADFFASPVCQEQMQQALERQRRGGVQVLPILVRRVDGKGARFAHLQALPRNGKPITSWSNEDEALAEVAEGIRRALEEERVPLVDASRTGLPPIWNVPYPRNPLFVGRDDVLIQLHQQLHAGQATALSQSPHALSGLGGIGKTQIAVEYAYRYAQEYEVVLWAQAESQESVQASYVEMASLLNLPEKEAQEQEKIIQAVKMWLQRHRDWLLILKQNLDIQQHDMNSKIVITLFSLFAELERDLLSLRTREALAAKKLQGVNLASRKAPSREASLIQIFHASRSCSRWDSLSTRLPNCWGIPTTSRSTRTSTNGSFVNISSNWIGRRDTDDDKNRIGFLG